MSVNYTVQLTTGDATTNYDIYYDAITPLNYATLIIGGGNATGVTYNDLFIGVGVTIPDTSTKIVIKSNGLCKNTTIIPINPQLPPTPDPDLCMTFTFEGNVYNFNFTPNGIVNGNTKWSYFDGVNTYDIVWNPRVSNGGFRGRWEMTFMSGLVFTTPNVSSVPDSGWYATGAGSAAVLNLQVLQGSCSGTSPLNAEVITTNTTCKNTSPCNGSIIIYPVGGTGVYQYSIDGLNYQQSNIFNGLCENTYLVNVKDSNGSILQLSATVSYDGVPKTYTGSVSITSQRILADTYNPQRKRIILTNWELTFDNSIDVGTYINFTLLFNDTQLVNGPGEGMVSGNTLVYLNSTLQTPSVNRTSTYINPRPNCGAANVTGTTINQNYVISMTNGDRLTGTSISEMTITVPDSNASGCATTLDQTIDVIASSNLQNPINGCQCCTVSFGKNNESFIIVRDEIQI